MLTRTGWEETLRRAGLGESDTSRRWRWERDSRMGGRKRYTHARM